MARFCTTRWSVVNAAGGADGAAARAALSWLCERMWEPLCAHVRRRGFRDAEDHVQGFIADLLERGAIAQADAARGRFRTWLLACLDHFLANRMAAIKAQKRGGTTRHEAADERTTVTSAEPDPAAAFDRDWAVAVIAEANHQLEQEANATPVRAQRLAVLRPFLGVAGDADAYAEAGRQLGLPEGGVRVAVHRLRARFRELVEAAVAETLPDPGPAEVAAEIDTLLAALRNGR